MAPQLFRKYRIIKADVFDLESNRVWSEPFDQIIYGSDLNVGDTAVIDGFIYKIVGVY